MAAKNTAWQAIIALRRRVCYLRAVVHRLCPGARGRVSAWSRRPSQSGKEPCRFGITKNSEDESRWVAYSLSIPSLLPLFKFVNIRFPVPALAVTMGSSTHSVPRPGMYIYRLLSCSHVSVAKSSPLTRLSTISRVVPTSVLLCMLLYNVIRSEAINPWPSLSHGKPGDSTNTRRCIKEPHTSISVLESMGLSQPRRPRVRFG